MSHTRPQELTSTKTQLESSPRTKKILLAKQVRKIRHQKIRPQTDWRSIE